MTPPRPQPGSPTRSCPRSAQRDRGSARHVPTGCECSARDMGGFSYDPNRNGRNKNRRFQDDEMLADERLLAETGLADWRGDYVEFRQESRALSPGAIASPKSRVQDECETVPDEWLQRFAKDAECKRVIGPRPQPWEPRKPTPRPLRPQNAALVDSAYAADSGVYEIEKLLSGLIDAERRSGCRRPRPSLSWASA